MEIILKKWNDFYEKNECIAELFYEIISNRSTGINQFLNLTQALEVYSCRYRKKEVEIIFNKLKIKDPKKHKKIALFHRLYDIFELSNLIFDFLKEDMEELSNRISVGRNYFTHYDRARYMKPNMEDIFMFNEYMRFILLSLVYREVGIEELTICEGMSRSRYGDIAKNIKKVIGSSGDDNNG